MAGYSGYRKYREQQRALGNEDETMASTSRGDRKRAGPPVTRSHAKRIAESNPDLDIDEGEMQSAMEAGFMSHGEGSGMMSGSGSDPIPMALPQHQRSVDKFTIKAAGTTFVGPGIDGTNVNNWYRFPWEAIAPFVNDWTTQEISQKWSMWKAENIKVQFKNPLCIQEIGSTTSALTTAGQNLHTNLYAYADNMYIRGTALPFGGLVEADYNNLISSWKHHGFAGGVPIKLPLVSLADTPAVFQNNWPDVKQCGMGPGKSLEFSWNITSPYWRHTNEFNVVAEGTPTVAFNPIFFSRWDERFGMISTWFNDPNPGATFSTPIDLQEPSKTQLLRSRWSNGTFAGFSGTASFVVPFIDPEPIPGLYLQLQPQLGALSAGISDSICQLQFEIEVDIVCTGRYPRMIYDGTGARSQKSTDNIFSGLSRSLTCSRPIFYPISQADIDGVANPAE